MTHVLADRVKETSTTTGTGTYTLAGAVVGFQSFAIIGNTNTTFYCATDGTDWEVGVGTYTSSGTTLARTTILASSNANAAVNWAAGTRTIFCDLPAEYALPLTTPGADRILFWDDSAGLYQFLTPGTGLAITGTSLDVSVKGMTLLGTLTTTSGSTQSLTNIPTSYQRLVCVLVGVSLTGSGAVNLAVSSNNGSSYGTAVLVTGSNGSSANTDDGTVTIDNVGQTSTTKVIVGTTLVSGGSGAVNIGTDASTTGQINAIRFGNNGGRNFDAGVIYIYGQ